MENQLPQLSMEAIVTQAQEQAIAEDQSFKPADIAIDYHEIDRLGRKLDEFIRDYELFLEDPLSMPLEGLLEYRDRQRRWFEEIHADISTSHIQDHNINIGLGRLGLLLEATDGIIRYKQYHANINFSD